MKILVTGASGFIGKNLIQELKNRPDTIIYECDVNTSKEELEGYCLDCDFVYHLAGVNRPKDLGELIKGNMVFTLDLINLLKMKNSPCPILFSSSTQAALDNPYGISKKACEELLFAYREETSAQIFIYRFPNIFGRWSRPNYNSVIATFCYNLTHNLSIQVNDRETLLNLVYIEDLVKELVFALEGKAHERGEGYYYIKEEYKVSLGEVSDILYSFKEKKYKDYKPHKENLNNRELVELVRKLYLTYKSYENYE